VGPAYPGCLPHVSTLDAAACLRAGGQACQACQDACSLGAIRLAAVATARTVAAGAVVVATGFTPGWVEGPPGFISTGQAERMLHRDGPTGGELRGAAGTPPRTVLLATTATETDGELAVREVLKLAHLIRARHPQVEVAVAGGLAHAPGLAALTRQLQAEGVELLEAGLLPDAPRAAAGAVEVRLAQGLLETERAFDLVVIHPPASASGGAAELAALLHVPVDARGFVVEGPASPFEPTATRVPGIFVAGAAAGPRPIRQAIRDGAAAAGRVLSTLVAGERRVLEPLVVEIDPARCGGCGICVATCAFGALGRDPATGKARAEPVHCRGCGTCAAACPTGAASARHFTRAQLGAEISALLAGTGTAG
jgi:heterodisulfide reductase subunit A